MRNQPRVLQWLDEMERRLGNCATEMVAVSPTEWSMTRRSPIGLTAAELVGLLGWTESLDFPRLSLRFPDEIPAKAPPGPQQQAAQCPRKRSEESRHAEAGGQHRSRGHGPGSPLSGQTHR